ncbi:efflux RND transporter periplasmic adaptor subunit [Isoalcanivorax indicus]|uniref:efflux RND transporter periplasmic adaptor subunit n=1 Tax=Isoalcanivorax indicus TaxID=2202653 RepID=UPI000DBAB71F|nr:efflux RND transporter periplasmic adaptor subunit [Isoalcanivorax indicus]
MKTLRHLSLILASASLFLLSGCGDTPPEDDDAGLRPVRVMTVGGDVGLTSRRFVGRVDAVSTVDLSFQVGGRIAELPVQQGSVVQAGGLIAALDPTDYRLAVREAEVQREQARRDLDRQRTLLERGTVSPAAFDQAKTQYDLADVALDNARRNLSYTRISAPFDALVTRRLVDRHTNVQPNTTVVRVQDVTELRVHINVPEHLVRISSEASLFDVSAFFSQHPDRPFKLEYREHETEPDAVTQTYQVSFGMPRPEDFNVLPGMTVTVEIRTRGAHADTSFQIPVGALDMTADGEFRVWIYDEESRAVSPRAVKVGLLGLDQATIIDGLDAGDTLVTAGTVFLRDGMRVRPFEKY